MFLGYSTETTWLNTNFLCNPSARRRRFGLGFLGIFFENIRKILCFRFLAYPQALLLCFRMCIDTTSVCCSLRLGYVGLLLLNDRTLFVPYWLFNLVGGMVGIVSCFWKNGFAAEKQCLWQRSIARSKRLGGGRVRVALYHIKGSKTPLRVKFGCRCGGEWLCRATNWDTCPTLGEIK